MNNFQLENFMLNDPVIRPYFGGIFARNEIPLTFDDPTILIANTDPNTKPGQHWVTMWIEKDGEYFDSAGMKPLKEFKRYLTVFTKNYKYSRMRIQNYDSDLCGEYCLVYSHYKCMGYSLDEIVSLFDDNLELNEFNVLRYLREITLQKTLV